VTQLGLLPPTPGAVWRSLAWAVTGRAAAARQQFLQTSGELASVGAVASADRQSGVSSPA
jgi:hypothetical protein